MDKGVFDAKAEAIVAIATAQGRAAIGIVRLTGSGSKEIAQKICRKELKPRFAEFCKFFDSHQQTIDEGICLFFPSPNSFTGEDIIEFQSHGSPQALNLIQQECVKLGARLAKPGEFTERAFLNGKIDLTQAEAIADVIEAQSEQSLKSANESLQGKFKRDINDILSQLINLRVYIEGAMDFAEEEIDFLENKELLNKFTELLEQLKSIVKNTKASMLLRQGVKVAIYGEPNVGKSTLLNQLTGRNVAIVTNVPGTTRDQLEQQIIIDGVPVLLIDTAGIRETEDMVEKQGVERAIQVREQADIVLNIFDATKRLKILELEKEKNTRIIVINKIDLVEKQKFDDGKNTVFISAKNNQGIDRLIQVLGEVIKSKELLETPNIARSRYVEALNRTVEHIKNAEAYLKQTKSGEIVAEELLLAQNALSEITGEYLPDDLLGEIFSRFCIGK